MTQIWLYDEDLDPYDRTYTAEELGLSPEDVKRIKAYSVVMDSEY